MNDYSSRKCCHKNSMSMMNNNMNIDMMDDFCDEDTSIVTTAQSDCANLCTMPQNNCDCGFDMDTESVFPDNPMLAQSYVPIQKMNKVFTPDVGLKMGTIFKLGCDRADFTIIILALIIIFIVGLLKEKGINVRELIAKQNIFVRWTLYYLLIIAIVIFGAYGFGYAPVDPIYANF